MSAAIIGALSKSVTIESKDDPFAFDLLRWFRQRRGYQTRINAILRAYMQAHESV
jgi:hypothetical protein